MKVRYADVVIDGDASMDRSVVQIEPVPRVSIQAFCESPDIAAIVAAAISDRRMAKAHVKQNMGGAAAALEAYKSAPTPNVVVLEAPASRDALLAQLEELAEYCDAGTKVVVLGKLNDIVLYRQLMMRGVSEYLVAPFGVVGFIQAISQLFAVPGAKPLGRVIAVVGAKGGVGASTVAHNLAWSLASVTEMATIIADFDLAFGTAGLDYNQDPPQGVAEAVFAPDRVDAVLVERLLSKCGEKLSLLAAPATLDRVLDFSEASFDSLLDAMRASTPWIVVDVPHVWSGWARWILVSADEVIVVASPDLANLRNTKNLIDNVKGARLNDAPSRLVLNGVGMLKRPEIAAAEFAKAVETDPTAIISHDAKLFGALIEAIDLAALSKLDPESAREEIRDIVHEIVTIKNLVLSIAEQEDLLDDICNDVLGFGPLEPLLARDDIADIMVNGPTRCFIEVGGRIQLTNVRFRDASQLMNICQRIVSQVGRRVDESSPICDARLLDGSRVNVIAPPLAIDGAALTIRKFRKDKLTLDQLVKFGSISPAGAEILKIIGRVRCNVVISGGTGSGKTTLLNCLTNYIDADERIITCEDAAELQLQQPHVVRLETRPANLEGVGQITMRDLVKNCLRMRPERIVVGEVRGPEAFDLLQAMNTGHDGSMGTLHANSPREALSRVESMITMGGYALPMKTIREMMTSSIDVIIQASRLRDGSRRITHITEVLGMEGDVVITQDLFVYELLGEDAQGKIIGRHRSTGIGRPKFWDRARMYGEEAGLAEALDISEVSAA